MRHCASSGEGMHCSSSVLSSHKKTRCASACCGRGRSLRKKAACNPRKKRKQISSRLVRRNRGPRFHISIVFTFLGALHISDACRKTRYAGGFRISHCFLLPPFRPAVKISQQFCCRPRGIISSHFVLKAFTLISTVSGGQVTLFLKYYSKILKKTANGRKKQALVFHKCLP